MTGRRTATLVVAATVAALVASFAGPAQAASGRRMMRSGAPDRPRMSGPRAPAMADREASSTQGCDAGSGVYLSASTDSATTWGTAVQAAANSATVFNDKPWVAVDRSSGSPGLSGNLYLAYTAFTYGSATDCQNDAKPVSSPILLRRSTDGGATWGPPVSLGGSSYTDDQGAAVGVAPNGDVYVAFEGSGPGCTDCLAIVRSTDGGQSFGAPAKIADIQGLVTLSGATGGFRANSFPTLAVEAGAVEVAWAEGRGSASTPDIWFARSTDGGATWTAPSIVNQGTAGDQFFPAMAVDADGSGLWIGYFDRRDDPNNVAYREYVSHSTDHGTTWTDTTVADAPSDPDSISFEQGTLFIGDYSGIAALPGGGAFATWCDTRNSTPQAGAQDIYGARLPGGTNVRISPSIPGNLQDEPSVAVSPDGNTFVVGANDYRNGSGAQSGYVVSHDGGSTWGSEGILPMPAGVESAGDPVVAFGANAGSVYYSGLGFASLVTELSIAVAPDNGVWGTTFAVSGSLTSGGQGVVGKAVTVQRRTVGGAWATLASPMSDGNGNWVVGDKPSANSEYQASFAGGEGLTEAAAGPVGAGVRVGVIANAASNVPHGGTAVFTGRILPAHPGRRVGLQLLQGRTGTWTWLGTAALDSSSSYRMTYRTTTYRGYLLFRVVYWTQDPDHMWNVGRLVKVTWA